MATQALNELIEALRCLPGVGPKSAQRMAFHLLERNRQGGVLLAQKMAHAMQAIGHCQRCRTFSETDVCDICQNSGRDERLLCIVETPADVIAIERTGEFRGMYFVLMGHLSPLDGIGPEELGLDLLSSRFDEGVIQELILATNATVEGEATAHYISELAQPHKIDVSRLAQGVPLGGELEYIDGGTLSRAFAGRTRY